MKSTREWLQENKVFFETAAAMLLSVMAIVVAIANLFIAIDQRNLTQIQTKVAEANALPRFEISTKQILNEESGRFEDSNLEIANNGGPIRNYQAQVKVVYFYNLSKGGLVIERQIPVSGFFGAQVIGSAAVGKLSTFLGNKNNKSFSELSQKLRLISRESGFDFANVEYKIYVQIVYTDLLERPKKEYYALRGVGYASAISSEEASAIFPDKLSELPIQISNIDPMKWVEELSRKTK